MRLRITHKTQYSYDAPVSYGLQQIRLTPLGSAQQVVHDWSLAIDGGQQELSFTDHHGNHTTLVQISPGVREINITASGEVETLSSDGVLGAVYGPAPLWHFMQDTPRTQAGAGIRALGETVAAKSDTLSALHDLSAAIRDAVPYGHAKTYVETSAEEALQAGGGVCQDHAQIFISTARLAGIPARYVSGYLMMDDRIDQDASHAWAEAHIEALGWVGFDISNAICPDERYVRIATGRDSHDAAPISGLRMGVAQEEMIVSLQVQQ